MIETAHVQIGSHVQSIQPKQCACLIYVYVQFFFYTTYVCITHTIYTIVVYAARIDPSAAPLFAHPHSYPHISFHTPTHVRIPATYSMLARVAQGIALSLSCAGTPHSRLVTHRPYDHRRTIIDLLSPRTSRRRPHQLLPACRAAWRQLMFRWWPWVSVPDIAPCSTITPTRAG